MLRRIAAYGLARSLRLPWWAWAIALALFSFVQYGVAHAQEASGYSGSVSDGISCASTQEPYVTRRSGQSIPGQNGEWTIAEATTWAQGRAEAFATGESFVASFTCGVNENNVPGCDFDVKRNDSGAGIVWVYDNRDINFTLSCRDIPQCEEEDGTPAGFNQTPTQESLTSGAVACYDGCGVYATMVVDGTQNPPGTTGEWYYDGTTCNQGMGDDVQLNTILGTVNGTEVSAPVDSHSLVPDSITMPDGTIVAGDDLDDYMSYITEDYAVVQGDDAAVHLNATASETITITNISNGDSNTINIYPGSGATAAPNAGDLNSGNSNGPGADTFPGDGDGDCDPLTEDCDDDPGDGDCDPETEDCEGEGGGCDPDEETCGGTFLGKALSAKTFGKSTADFMTDVRGTPLGEAISDVESNMPSGGNCPAPTIDLTDWNMGSYTFDTHCVLLEEWRSQIRISMLAFYALLGIFVFLRRS